MKKNGTVHECGLTLFSQKSEHIVTTHSSMSGSNKLVESITPAFYESYVSPRKKKSYGGTILQSIDYLLAN
jgi:hypothetical protein